MKTKKPIALLSAREVARALAITQDRFARAVRNGRVQADYIAIDLFLPSSTDAAKCDYSRNKKPKGARPIWP